MKKKNLLRYRSGRSDDGSSVEGIRARDDDWAFDPDRDAAAAIVATAQPAASIGANATHPLRRVAAVAQRNQRRTRRC